MTLVRLALRFVRHKKLSIKGVDIGEKVLLGSGIKVSTTSQFWPTKQGKIEIGAEVKISDGVILHSYGGDILVGSRSFLGPYVIIYGHGSVSIGNDTLIAMGVKIISANHEIAKVGILINSRPNIAKRIVIGNDVWIGADAKILAGVTIGEGAVIGANSVVTKNIPPFAVAVGTPARIIKFRPQ